MRETSISEGGNYYQIYGNLLEFFTCRKEGTWDWFFYFPSEGRHTEDFPDTRKIQRLRPGLNPRIRVPVASMLTTRPSKPSRSKVTCSPDFFMDFQETSSSLNTFYSQLLTDNCSTLPLYPFCALFLSHPLVIEEPAVHNHIFGSFPR